MPAALKFRLVSGLRRSERRAVGFLYGDPQLNACDAFLTLDENSRRRVLSSMGEWIDGKPDITSRFHGFLSDSQYTTCFVFKVKTKRQGHRFYGCLCHPLPKSKARFQLCVLCVHAKKNEWETDRSELARVTSWSAREETNVQLKLAFPDGGNSDIKKGQVLAWKK